MRVPVVVGSMLIGLGLGIASGEEGAGPAPSDGDVPAPPAGRSAPLRDRDGTLTDSTFAGWIGRVLGDGVPVRWEGNDCGESSGSPADTARSLPACMEASAVLSGGRELTIRAALGAADRGAAPTAELHFAEVAGPDSSIEFHRLQEVEEYLERERPFARNDSVYLDDRRNVRVVTESGRHVRLLKEGPFRDPKLSPDGRLIGMMPVSVVDHEAENGSSPVEVATEVWIYRGGKVARRFEPGGFVRAWDFVGAGDSVAVYAGGLHFAGYYVLYDLASGEERDRAEDPVTDQSPAWVRRLAP